MSIPKRPLTHKALPLTGASGFEVTPITFPSLTLKSKLQPTPQNVQVVWTFDTSHVRPLPTICFSTSAPTGQTETHDPQKSQSDSLSVSYTHLRAHETRH